MIHIWLANSHINTQNNALRVWQPTTQSWQTAENWQEVAVLANLQNGTKSNQKSVCLYFPSVNVLTLAPNLSAHQLKALGEAGRRYLFEEISIGGVEDLQVKVDNTAMPNLYAIHQSDREQWEHALTLAGLTLSVLLPDFVLLPTEKLPLPDSSDLIGEQAMNAFYYQDTATQLIAYCLPMGSLSATPKATASGRKKPHRTLMSQGEMVAYLPLWLTHITQVKHISIQQLFIYIASVGNGFPVLEPMTQIMAQTAMQQPQLMLHEVSQDRGFAPRIVNEPGRNFYNFAVKAEQTKLPQYLRTIITISLLAWLVNLAVDGMRWYYYQQAATQTQIAIATQYNQWFPTERLNTRLSLERQLQSKLQPLNSNNNVLTTLSKVQTSLQQYQITAKNLTYQTKNLQLDVTAKDSDALNKAVSQLTSQGLAAKLGNVSNTAGMAIGQLQIGL